MHIGGSEKSYLLQIDGVRTVGEGGGGGEVLLASPTEIRMES
jgi:hypothetical protein